MNRIPAKIVAIFLFSGLILSAAFGAVLGKATSGVALTPGIVASAIIHPVKSLMLAVSVSEPVQPRITLPPLLPTSEPRVLGIEQTSPSPTPSPTPTPTADVLKAANTSMKVQVSSQAASSPASTSAPATTSSSWKETTAHFSKDIVTQGNGTWNFDITSPDGSSSVSVHTSQSSSNPDSINGSISVSADFE